MRQIIYVFKMRQICFPTFHFLKMPCVIYMKMRFKKINYDKYIPNKLLLVTINNHLNFQENNRKSMHF